jgi:hypothetical membrane protein
MNQQQTLSLTGTPRPLFHNILLSCGIAGSILFTVFYFIEASLVPGFSSTRQTISDLELVNNGWMQSANFIMMGILTCFFTVGLRLELRKGAMAVWLPFFQLLVALGVIASGIFIYNPLHTIASMVAFIPLIICFFLFARLFKGDPRWRGWAAYSIISAVLMMAFLYLFGMEKANGGPAGLYERLVVLVRSVWSLIFTIRLLKGVRLTPLD